ncbi:hypothetical protein D3C76_1493260 [compost metagenome]
MPCVAVEQLANRAVRIVTAAATVVTLVHGDTAGCGGPLPDSSLVREVDTRDEGMRHTTEPHRQPLGLHRIVQAVLGLVEVAIGALGAA